MCWIKLADKARHRRKPGGLKTLFETYRVYAFIKLITINLSLIFFNYHYKLYYLSVIY
jgi:hypothetical protein